jgi:hypothetical protein
MINKTTVIVLCTENDRSKEDRTGGGVKRAEMRRSRRRCPFELVLSLFQTHSVILLIIKIIAKPSQSTNSTNDAAEEGRRRR